MEDYRMQAYNYLQHCKHFHSATRPVYVSVCFPCFYLTCHCILLLQIIHFQIYSMKAICFLVEVYHSNVILEQRMPFSFFLPAPLQSQSWVGRYAWGINVPPATISAPARRACMDGSPRKPKGWSGVRPDLPQPLLHS